MNIWQQPSRYSEFIWFSILSAVCVACFLWKLLNERPKPQSSIGKSCDKMSQGKSMVAHLDMARAKLAEGKGPEALQIVMQVIRATKGEAAMFDTLHKMKKRIDQHEAAEAGADQLCAQLEESCFIDEGSIDEAERLCCILENQDTFLSERGAEDILRDAFEDGSSIVCTHCGDLISRARWRAHVDLWCSKLPPSDAVGDMDIYSD